MGRKWDGVGEVRQEQPLVTLPRRAERFEFWHEYWVGGGGHGKVPGRTEKPSDWI